MTRRRARAGHSTTPPHLAGVALLRQQLGKCNSQLEQAVAATLQNPSCSPPWSPDVRLYLHALCVQDITIQSVLREAAPLFTSLWPNLGHPANVAALQQYARAVYASTDAYLVALPADGLNRVVDLHKLGLGRHTVGWVTRRFVVQELTHISSEITGGSATSETALAASRFGYEIEKFPSDS